MRRFVVVLCLVAITALVMPRAARGDCLERDPGFTRLWTEKFMGARCKVDISDTTTAEAVAKIHRLRLAKSRNEIADDTDDTNYHAAFDDLAVKVAVNCGPQDARVPMALHIASIQWKEVQLPKKAAATNHPALDVSEYDVLAEDAYQALQGSPVNLLLEDPTGKGILLRLLTSARIASSVEGMITEFEDGLDAALVQAGVIASAINCLDPVPANDRPAAVSLPELGFFTHLRAEILEGREEGSPYYSAHRVPGFIFSADPGDGSTAVAIRPARYSPVGSSDLRQLNLDGARMYYTLPGQVLTVREVEDDGRVVFDEVLPTGQLDQLAAVIVTSDNGGASGVQAPRCLFADPKAARKEFTKMTCMIKKSPSGYVNQRKEVEPECAGVEGYGSVPNEFNYFLAGRFAWLPVRCQYGLGGRTITISVDEVLLSTDYTHFTLPVSMFGSNEKRKTHEADAITHYAGSGFQMMNTLLFRAGRFFEGVVRRVSDPYGDSTVTERVDDLVMYSPDIVADTVKAIALLTPALVSAEPMPTSVTRTGWGPNERDLYLEACRSNRGVYTWDSLMSTSTNTDLFDTKGHPGSTPTAYLTIRGLRTVDGRDISEDAIIFDEREVLLKPMRRFHIKNCSDAAAQHAAGTMPVTFDMELVPDVL